MNLTPEALLSWIESRRSVRSFDERPVPRALLERILQTACAAPSAHNSQPWRFAVVSPGEERENLANRMAEGFRRDLRADGFKVEDVEARASRAVGRLLRAPAAVVLCSTISGSDRYPDTRREQAERTMALQSVSLAGGQLLLAAHAEGLGACWMCGPLFAPQAVREALRLPADWEPQALIVLGWPAEQPSAPDRRPLDDTVIWR
jgi:coenzyme F420-0:L-glutamate ligase/coenzyme F420-1:gamma-L-glutamate ligase